MNICLAGSEIVSRAQLHIPPLPKSTPTYQPIGHDYFVDLVESELSKNGFKVIEQVHGLHNEGKNYFGMFKVAGQDLTTNDYALMVGMRNSHAKKFAAGIALGANVFVCDNMSFSGEIKTNRKHSGKILKDIDYQIAAAIGGTRIMAAAQNMRFESYKSRQLKAYEAEHFMIEALRRGIMNAHRLPKLVQQWDAPDHDSFARTGRSAWRMFNAATEALKGTNIVELSRKTEALHDLTDEIVELAA